MVRERFVRLADVARRLLEERGDRGVALAALRARERLVRDVLDEPVLERELLVALDPGDRLAADEVALPRASRAACDRSRPLVDARERAPPEDAPDDGGVDSTVRSVGRQRVEAGGDDRADARRQLVTRRSVVCSASDGGELLDEERVALGGLRDRLGARRASSDSVEQLLGELAARSRRRDGSSGSAV